MSAPGSGDEPRDDSPASIGRSDAKLDRSTSPVVASVPQPDVAAAAPHDAAPGAHSGVSDVPGDGFTAGPRAGLVALRAPASGAADWLAVQGAVLRGLVHALSNRVGTVVAVAGTLHPDVPASARLVGAMQGEGERLVTLLERLRTLVPPRDDPFAEEAEPIVVPALLEEVVALAAYHPARRDAAPLVAVAPGTPPVVAPPDRLRLALLALAATAGADGAAVRLEAVAEAGVGVVVRAMAEAPGEQAGAGARAAAWLVGGHATVVRPADALAGGWALVLTPLGAR